MTKSLLDKIPYKIIKTDKGEELNLYSLGIFNGSAYNIVEAKIGNYEPHIHSKSKSLVHIISGSGIVILGREEIPYKKGDIFLIPAKVSHCFRVEEQTLFLAIETPPIINPITREIDFEYVNMQK